MHRATVRRVGAADRRVCGVEHESWPRRREHEGERRADEAGREPACGRPTQGSHQNKRGGRKLAKGVAKGVAMAEEPVCE
eukprot:2466190-Prymnesium_polylepis.2